MVFMTTFASNRFAHQGRHKDKIANLAPHQRIKQLSLHVQECVYIEWPFIFKRDPNTLESMKLLTLRSSFLIHGTPFLILHFSTCTHLIPSKPQHKTLTTSIHHSSPTISPPKSFVTFHQNTHISRHILYFHSLHLGAQRRRRIKLKEGDPRVISLLFTSFHLLLICVTKPLIQGIDLRINWLWVQLKLVMNLLCVLFIQINQIPFIIIDLYITC